MDKQNMMYYALNATFVGDSSLRPGKRFRYMVNAFQYYNEGDADTSLVDAVNHLSSVSMALAELEDMIGNMSGEKAARAIAEAAHYASNNITSFSITGPIVTAPDKEEVMCAFDKILKLEERLSKIDVCSIAKYIRRKAVEKGDM